MDQKLDKIKAREQAADLADYPHLKKIVEGQQKQNTRLRKISETKDQQIATLKKALAIAKDDFTDFVRSGASNPALYCLNNSKNCTDVRGWCKPGCNGCKGFIPSFVRQAQTLLDKFAE